MHGTDLTWITHEQLNSQDVSICFLRISLCKHRSEYLMVISSPFLISTLALTIACSPASSKCSLLGMQEWERRLKLSNMWWIFLLIEWELVSRIPSSLDTRTSLHLCAPRRCNFSIRCFTDFLNSLDLLLSCWWDIRFIRLLHFSGSDCWYLIILQNPKLWMVSFLPSSALASSQA